MAVAPSALSVLGYPSMCGRLAEVLVIAPQPDMEWQGLGYPRAPDRELALRQHRAFTALLDAAGATVREAAPAGLSADAVYCHDASFPTERGMVLMRMGKQAREAEPDAHRAIWDSLGIPVIGAIKPPGIAEGGDLVWLDSRTLLAGEGYRTNAAGIDQLRALLEPDWVTVTTAPLPHGDGPGACLHLMSLLSVLDEQTILIDPRLLAVATMQFLDQQGFRTIPIVEEERDTMAANVLALGFRDLLALSVNVRTNERLRNAGFRVYTFDGSEICQNGVGGPTCLTRPIRRR